MERAIVTGITGHLGQEIARQLAAAGVRVCGLTRQESAVRESQYDGVSTHHIDGRTESLVKLFESLRPDTVFHVAGLYRREHQTIDVASLVDSNVLFGTQLLEAMRLIRCQRIIIAGSYFQHFDCNEHRALNLYAATKQAFEAFVSYYMDAHAIEAVRLTLPDIYSEHDTRPKLINAIARAWADALPLVLQDEKARIDPVHVEDVAAAFLHAASMLEAGAIPCHSLSHFSVTCGRDVSATELVGLFERLGSRKVAIESGRGSPPPRKMRPWRGGVLPGWAPRVTLETGVARIVERQRKKQNGARLDDPASDRHATSHTEARQ